MKTLSLAVCLSAMFFVYGCGNGGTTGTGQTPIGTPVSLTTFNGFFKGYSSAGTQLSFANMTGSVRFNNMTGVNSHGRCSGTYTVVAVGPTTFENLQVTESTTSLAVLTGPIPPVSFDVQRYFLVSNGSLYKITDVPGTLFYFDPLMDFAMPPNPANVGDFGTIATLAGSDGSTLAIGWELSPEFHGNSIMIITSVTRNILNIVTASEVDKYYLDRAGNPYKFATTVTSGGVTITMAGNRS
ncbi:MAG TPA: hypothetical protein VI298_08235 [Geobacteraceae bacterium]